MMSFLASRYLSAVLLLLYALLLALATWVEKAYGTEIAWSAIYVNPCFLLFQALIVLNMGAILWRGRYGRQRRYAMLLTHGAIFVIFLGALLTHLFGQEGVMHIREGESKAHMLLKGAEAGHVVHLPFQVELRDFELSRYHGSSSPSSYESHITLHYDGQSRDESIYMNHTLDVAGYRLFQLSFDHDERGTVLLVNQDVLGRRVTYTGYILLGLGLLVALFGRRSRIAFLLESLARLKASAPLFLGFALLASLSLGGFARAESPAPPDGVALTQQAQEAIRTHQLPKEEAARFGRLAMQDASGRLVPVNTFASQLLRKFYHAEEIWGLSPEQFLLSVWLMPHAWQYVPFIYYKNPDLCKEYALPENYISMADLFDAEGNYKLQEDVRALYQKDANERSLRDKDLLKIDEKVNLFNQLVGMGLLRLFPNELDASHRWFAPGDDLSSFDPSAHAFVTKVFAWYLAELGEALGGKRDWAESQRVLGMMERYQRAIGAPSGYNADKLDAEIRYNAYRINPRCKLIYLVFGGALFVLSLLRFSVAARWLLYLQRLFLLVAALALAAQTYGIGLRWYIAGHAPWSSSYETMVYIAWVSALLGLVLARRSAFVSSLALIFAGVVLFVSGLQWMDPHITPLVPVLKSAWLMFHVAVIVAAYGFFGIAALIALSNMLLMIGRGRKPHAQIDYTIKELSIINEILLWFGLALMAIGSYLGAVWANESWGRYWGWDPKETWALITILTYVGVTHLSFLKKGYSLWLFNFLSLMALWVVLMTYFGVNYFLSGMHAYSSTQLSPEILAALGFGFGGMLVLGLLAALRGGAR